MGLTIEPEFSHMYSLWYIKSMLHNDNYKAGTIYRLTSSNFTRTFKGKRDEKVALSRLINEAKTKAEKRLL